MGELYRSVRDIPTAFCLVKVETRCQDCGQLARDQDSVIRACLSRYYGGMPNEENSERQNERETGDKVRPGLHITFFFWARE